MTSRAPATPAKPSTPQTIREMVEEETRDRARMSQSERAVNRISAFAGSLPFVGLHVGWFAAWILINTSFGAFRFDAFPYGLLTMMVSLEAIFLSTFVLISQNRQSLAADKRARIDLQVNLLSEREVTKVMALVAEIHQHLGLSDGKDVEVRGMQETTNVAVLADAVDRAERDAGERTAATTER